LAVINDIEALLIRAMGLVNIRQTQFEHAEEWFQVNRDEVERYLDRIA
jgi:hypothetical protein